MTNVWTSPEKVDRRGRLFNIAVQTLQREGWTVERIPNSGKSSVRRITKDGKSQVASIRTSQDTWIAFPRNKKDTEWVTLSEVDVVVAVSVDDAASPKFARVHMLDGDEMRARFDRAYSARRAANHSIPRGRGVWLSLYHDEAKSPVQMVGAGAGIAHAPIATVSLDPDKRGEEAIVDGKHPNASGREGKRLTIAEAKVGLALLLGVDPANIKITVEA